MPIINFHYYYPQSHNKTKIKAKNNINKNQREISFVCVRFLQIEFVGLSDGNLRDLSF